MRYESFRLYQLVENFDDYGNSKNDYEYIEDIKVYINEQHLKVMGVDTYYFVKALQGVTPYSKFEFGEQYKLCSSQHEYSIQSFINGRLSQLVLEEVTI